MRGEHSRHALRDVARNGIAVRQLAAGSTAIRRPRQAPAEHAQSNGKEFDLRIVRIRQPLSAERS